MNRSTLFAVLTSVVVGSGCAEIQPFLPKVTFDGLDVRTLDWQEAGVDFVFRVENPNPIQIGLASFAYDLDLEQVNFLSGDNPDGFTLEPSGASDLVLPLDLVYEEIWGTVQALRGEDQIDFGLAGQMGFDTPAGELPLGFREEGDFPALRTPKFSIEALRVPTVNLSGATLELDLGVDNDHGSTLFFDKLDFDVSLNDSSIATGLVNTFDVPGATKGTLTLPIEVALLDIGASLFDALVTGAPLDLSFGASMDVDTPFGILPLSVDEQGNISADIL